MPNPVVAELVPDLVPALVHFLWTGPGFGLCHRLAIESVLLTNPGLDVTLHLIEDEPRDLTANPHLASLRAHPRLRFRQRTPPQILAACELPHDGPHAPSLLATFQRIPPRAASAQSNLLRYAILHQEGGIYLDLDVLVVRDLEPLRAAECSLGTELVWRADEARVAGQLAPWMLAPTAAFAAALALRRAELALRTNRATHGAGTSTSAGTAARLHHWLQAHWSQPQPNNAVIAAAPRAPFITALLERAPHVDATVRFRLGPTLVAEVARRLPHAVRLLPPDVLYFVPPSQSFRFFRDRALALPASALLIHYVSSNHRRELTAIARDGLAAAPPSLFRSLASAVAAGRAPLS